MSTRPLLLLVTLTSLAANAGLGSFLGKLGKTGKVVGKGARAGSAGARLGRLGAAGVTSAVAAERAGRAFAHLGDDAARSAGYLARAPDGELMMLTRTGQTTESAATLGGAVERLAPQGQTPTVLLDHSAAGAEDLLAKLPPDTTLALVEEGKLLPVRRSGAGDAVDFVVETVSGAVDLGDYLGEEYEPDDDGVPVGVFIGVGVIGVLVLVWKVRRAA